VQQRLFILNHVLTCGHTAPEATRVLGPSVRQVGRLLKRYRADGPAGLVYGHDARIAAHRTSHLLRARIVELATTTNALVNHAHLAEVLAEWRRSPSRNVMAQPPERPVRLHRGLGGGRAW
jgi:hypothetical protein